MSDDWELVVEKIISQKTICPLLEIYLSYTLLLGDKHKGSNSGSKMINTSYEDNFTFLRRQQQQANENNRERLRASPAGQSVSSQNHHASATSLSSEESAFLVPRPKPSSPKEVSTSDADGNALKSSQPIKK